MGGFADNDCDRRCADQSVIRGVPTDLREDPIPRRDEAADVGLGGSPDKHGFGAAWQTKQVHEPLRYDSAQPIGDR